MPRCTWTHEQYIGGTGKAVAMWLTCLAGGVGGGGGVGIPSNLDYDSRRIHMTLVWDVEDRLRWVSSGWATSNTFQVSTCRASPINTSLLAPLSPSSLSSKWGSLEGFGKAGKARRPLPSESKRLSVPSQPSFYPQRFCLHRETIPEHRTVSAWRRTGQRGLSSILCSSVSTVLVCLIGHLQPRCFTFAVTKGFSAWATL